MESDSLTAQLLNMVLENNAFKEKILPYVITWLVFNIILLALVIYVSVRITFR